MTTTTWPTSNQPANCLTIRDAVTGEILGMPRVGSRSVMWQDRTGTVKALADYLRDMQETGVAWDWFRLTGEAAERRIAIRDEYRY